MPVTISAPPKVALLLSGLPRMWRQCLPSQLALFAKHQVEVFFHFWDVIDEREKAELLELLKPRAYQFEAPQDFSNADQDPSLRHDKINIPSRLLSQYYSWRGVGQLFAPFKANYTVAMRSRADLQFVYNIDHIYPQLQSHDILIPWWQQAHVLLADLFALGGVEPIAYYHTLFDQVRSYAATKDFNPELMLTTHFEQRPDFHIYGETHQYFFVRRPHMENYTIAQAMQENPGQNKWLDPEVVAAHKHFHGKVAGEQGVQYVDQFQCEQLQHFAESATRAPFIKS